MDCGQVEMVIGVMMNASAVTATLVFSGALSAASVGENWLRVREL